MQTFYKALRTLWPYVGCLLGVYTLVTGLGFTLPELGAAAKEYILRVNVLLLVLAALFFFTAYTEIRHRGIPLTAMDTQIEVVYDDPLGRSVTVSRKQKLRANREDVTGYIRKQWCDGKLPKESVECSISHAEQATQSIHFDQGPHGVEVIHRFPAIPRDFFRLGTNTVTREDRTTYTDSFTAEEESYEVEIPPHYRHHKLAVSVIFHPSRTCAVKGCQAIRISAHGVSDIPLTLVNGRPGVRFEAKGLSGGERFRVMWKLPPVTPTQNSA